jgi:uncharacterized RDD family membrane protein YckC
MTSVPPPLPPVWDAAPASSASVAYGGFWIRVVAYVIDGILLSIAGGILGVVTGERVYAGEYADFHPVTNLASVVLAWLYFALMESSERGATVGKIAVGLRVVTDQGQRLSFLNATGRYLAKFISALILCIGFIMVAFTDRKRGLHDMMAGTLVIKTR